MQANNNSFVPSLHDNSATERSHIASIDATTNMILMSIARFPRHFNHMGHEKDSTFSNTALTSPLANIASESEEYCKRVERRVRELESENRVLRTELAARQSVGVATDPYSAAVPEPPSRTWNHIFFKPIPILTAFRRTSETP